MVKMMMVMMKNRWRADTGHPPVLASACPRFPNHSEKGRGPERWDD